MTKEQADIWRDHEAAKLQFLSGIATKDRLDKIRFTMILIDLHDCDHVDENGDTLCVETSRQDDDPDYTRITVACSVCNTILAISLIHAFEGHSS